MYNKCRHTGVDFKGAAPPRVDTEWGEIHLAPSVFWQVMPTWHSRYKDDPKLRTETEPECGEDLFFWSYPEFGDKIPH